MTSGLEEFVSDVAELNIHQGSKACAHHTRGDVFTQWRQTFAQKVTHGVADSVSKFTNSVSTAMGRASLDRDYQQARERFRQDAKARRTC